MTNLVLLLLRTYLSTNFIPEYYSGPPPVLLTNTATGNTYYSQAQNAVAVFHPAHTQTITNYVIGVRVGTNRVELLTLRPSD